MKKILLTLTITGLLVSLAHAESESPVNAGMVMQRMLAHRATQDFSLKARVFVARDQPVEVEMLVRNTTNETRTLYRSGKTELLIIQAVAGPTRWFQSGKGELLGAKLSEKWLGSQFTFYDLGTPFLRWANPKSVGEGRVRGQDCYALEVTSPEGPYRRVKLWVDQQYFALLRVEAFDEKDALVRRMAITSFNRLGELWIPRGIDMAFIPPNQFLPAEEKSRLEIYDGNYAAHLPAEWFAEERLAVVPASR